ncbi:MAG: PIN domain-containing protein [Candidatus Neomarinimicrobiota bacterium]
MKVLVDTSVWSSVLRRKTSSDDVITVEFRGLVEELRARMIGPIRQEILSGILTYSHFEVVRDHLRAFWDLDMITLDYERAAEFFNICRSKGIQGSNTDFLICAVSERHNVPIFTTDKDFEYFVRYLPIRLHRPE